ncbi:MAG: fluoride efflux transporter CrcB [Runella slithyformis]|jgi:fluoride exporter|nr:MAG: fluoride efflux transporter CrcB [Runella sp.]TAG17401.1 MAG: fluoride efflux transporter CrcB [Cytophagales bacterium]TAG39019.1 MAG: fluoride efflux transporter CrcB [Cytophagia bacterium]TAG51218.1 MAG: fluoride efflux transporter CrcB [Runella slithyformis]TAG79315.1 MAG: fluoride efflux transporter CrcB [Cytophagales bacterium]
MTNHLLLVGFGGAIGSICRYATVLLFSKFTPVNLPFGTFVANVLGCLLIGIFYGLGSRWAWFTPAWRLLLATGFCGGYTTFSAFAYENLVLLQTQQYSSFFIYTLGSLAVGIGAVALGFWLAK